MAVAALLVSPAFATPASASDVTPRNGAIESRKTTAKPRVVRASKASIALAPEQHATPLGLASQLPQSDAAIRSDSTTATIWRQTGVASWYGGSRWQGNRTASGARYDQNQLTAAHATLPIGTKVRVTLEGTDRSVVVLINDRPGTRRRIIDLSRSAAAELGILAQGVAVVTLSAL
jgi:rare lipoprotein A (peptidoglycan hydrolase)